MTVALRQQLVEANDAAALVAADLAAAQEALGRGQTILAGLEREMSAYSDLDGEVARHRAASIRAGASATSALPDNLAQRLAARAALAAEIDSYRVAVGELADDCKREEERVVLANAARSAIAVSIMSEEGGVLARELMVIEKRAVDIRLQLDALGRTWAPNADGTMAPVSLAADTLLAIRSNPGRDVPPIDRERAAQIWDGYRVRLMADPFAPLDPARTSNSSGNDGGFHANE